MRGILMTVDMLRPVDQKNDEMSDTRYPMEFLLVLILDLLLTHRGFRRVLRHLNIHINWVLHLQSRNHTIQAGPNKPRRYPVAVYTIHHMKRLVAPSNSHRPKNRTWTIRVSKIASLSKACSRSRLHPRLKSSPTCKQASSLPVFRLRLLLLRNVHRRPFQRRHQRRSHGSKNLHSIVPTKTTIDMGSIPVQLLPGTTIQFQSSTNPQVHNQPEPIIR